MHSVFVIVNSSECQVHKHKSLTCSIILCIKEVPWCYTIIGITCYNFRYILQGDEVKELISRGSNTFASTNAPFHMHSRTALKMLCLLSAFPNDTLDITEAYNLILNVANDIMCIFCISPNRV